VSGLYATGSCLSARTIYIESPSLIYLFCLLVALLLPPENIKLVPRRYPATTIRVSFDGVRPVTRSRMLFLNTTWRYFGMACEKGNYVCTDKDCDRLIVWRGILCRKQLM
jgi:hypothetical protein